MSSRDAILARIRKAQSEKQFEPQNTNWSPDDVFQPVGDLLETFCTEAEAVSASVILCADEASVLQSIRELIQERGWEHVCSADNKLNDKLIHSGIALCDMQHAEQMQAGITTCEYLVARTGSVIVSAATSNGRKMHAYSPVHVVIAREEQLVAQLEDALILLQEKYKSDLPSAITVITGPSRTADIEKTLVMGAHGPKELIIFVQRR